MNKEELVKMLEGIEWTDFEAKEASFEVPKESWKTVSAFSNTAGGWLVFGVKKEGKKYTILGVKKPDKIEQDFTTTLRNQKFNKIITPECNKYLFDDKIVLAFYIPQKSPRDKPIYFGSPDNIFIRTASGDQRATKEEIDSFYRTASFEEKDRELTKFGFNAIDIETLRRYRNLFTQMNPGHKYLTLNDEEFLQHLSAIQDNKLTYGGLLVFGKEEILQKALTNFRIEYLEIPGPSYDKAQTRYMYRLSSERNLFLTFFDISERVFQKLGSPFRIKDGLRDDDPEQIQAIREALVNLLMHTDYFSTGNARIRVFRHGIA